jgi:IclR family acetate operon transcriptional repressor
MRSTEWNDSPGSLDSVLARAYAIVSAFNSDDESVKLSELARRTGLPKATVHRFLQQLCLINIVERTAHGYQLGMRLFELGMRQPVSRDLRAAAVPILGDLRDATHETVHLAVLDDAEVLYVEKLVGHHGPPLASRVGGKLPAHCTGVGKALLAFGPKDVAEAVLRGPLRRLTPRTIVLPGPLSRELAKIRREGVAYESEESAVGVVCAACPIMGPEGIAVAAISVAGWAHSFDPLRFAPAVRTAALAVSRQLAETHNQRVRLPRSGSPSRLRGHTPAPRHVRENGGDPPAAAAEPSRADPAG